MRSSGSLTEETAPPRPRSSFRPRRSPAGSPASETVKVFGAMPIWRPAVGWVELAKPSVQALTVLPMLGFVPQPSLRGFLHSLSSVGTRGATLQRRVSGRWSGLGRIPTLERGYEYGRNDD
jgi:hypothetical protein